MDFTRKSWEYLSLISDIPWPQNWFVYGRCTANFALGNIPRLPIHYVDGVSLLECDILFRWFAINHDWVIIPWGGCTARFNSFLFISRNQQLRDSFVNNCSNTVNGIESSYARMLSANLSIAQYDVENDFSNYSRCVLMSEDLPEVGTLLWDVCNLSDRNLPWVITYPMDDDCHDDTPFGLVEAKDFRYVTTLELTPKPNNELYPCERLGVYEPKDREALIAMLQTHWQDPDTLLVVPNDANLNLLLQLLQKTGHYGFDTSYSELSFLQETLEIGEWFYQLNADRNDYKYSLFVSNNTQIIRQVDGYCQSHHNYCSIAYF